MIERDPSNLTPQPPELQATAEILATNIETHTQALGEVAARLLAFRQAESAEN
jgi:hypothetical protein